LSIYDARGRRVGNLVSEVRKPGHYEIAWNGRSDEGAELASGVYFFKLRLGDVFQLRKMLLIR